MRARSLLNQQPNMNSPNHPNDPTNAPEAHRDAVGAAMALAAAAPHGMVYGNRPAAASAAQVYYTTTTTGGLPPAGPHAKAYGLVTDINHNDVLLGRGKETINYIGNVRFRQLIEDNKLEYVNNTSKNGKDMVARRVWREVENRGGRFLKKSKDNVFKDGRTAWIEQAMDVAVLKIKQVRVVRVCVYCGLYYFSGARRRIYFS